MKPFGYSVVILQAAAAGATTQKSDPANALGGLTGADTDQSIVSP
jgi:hypothetical protein